MRHRQSRSTVPNITRRREAKKVEALADTDYSIASRYNTLAVEAGSSRAIMCTMMTFAISGAAALSYEIVWLKRLSHVWGSAAVATASVIGSFLFGIGIGNLLGGLVVRRLASPIRAYALCEFGVGVFAIGVPFGVSLISQALSISWLDNTSPVLYALVRIIFTTVVIGPPCILMGMTLPLLCGALERSRMNRASIISHPYAFNAVGAALGCGLTGFLLLPRLGIELTNWCAVGGSMLAGLMSIYLGRGWRLFNTTVGREEIKATREGGAAVLADSRSAIRTVAASAMIGFSALVCQLVWNRQIAHIVGGTVYAFASILVMILFGIGIGGVAWRLVCSWFSNQATMIATVVMLLVSTILAGQLLIPLLTEAVGALRDLREVATVNTLVCTGVAAIIVCVPAVLSGMLFPALVSLLERSCRAPISCRIAWVAAANTSGTLCACVVTSTVLIPFLGIDRTLCIGSASAVVALAVGGILSSTLQVCMFVVSLGLAASLTVGSDVLVKNLGMYMYGYIDSDEREKYKTLMFREGSTSSVLVTERDGVRSLRVDGKVDASSQGDMPMQLGLAYFPRFVHPSAESVLVIGFGSGCTTGASLLFPNTEVLCAELEPAVVSASSYFEEWNHNPLASNRCSIAFDDARSVIRRTDRRFDLVLSEPSNPWMAGISNLFTLEFYRDVAARLSFHGVFAQWVQLYSLTAQDYSLIVRTVKSVFPHCAIVLVSTGDSIVLASMQPIQLDAVTAAAAQRHVDSQSQISQDLYAYFGCRDVVGLLLRHVIASDIGVEKISALSGSCETNTDYNLRLECDAPLRLFGRRGNSRNSAHAAVLGVVEPEFARDLSLRLCANQEQLLEYSWQIELLAGLGMLKKSVSCSHLIASDGPSSFVRSSGPNGTWRQRQSDERRMAVRDICKVSDRAASEIGAHLLRRRRYILANEVFEELSSTYPTSTTIMGKLAESLWAHGDRLESQRWVETASAADPFNEMILGVRRKLKYAAVSNRR